MKYIISLTLLAMMLAACSSEKDPIIDYPDAVTMVARTADTSFFENGIDAVPETDAIQIVWHKLDDFNVRYYTVYRRSETENTFEKIRTVDLNAVTIPFDSTYIDNDSLQLEIYYHYFVRAVSKNGDAGPPSDTVSYKLLAKPLTERPNSEQVTGAPVFTWTFNSISGIPDQFILRIEEEFTQQTVYVKQMSVILYDWRQTLDTSGLSDFPVLQSNVSYRWRIDVIGPDQNSSGSESEWKTFRMN